MITDLKPYPSMKDSGVPWLGEVPDHWEVRRTRNAVDMRVSSVDKHTKEGELPVRLCNYIDVYKNDRITDRVSFMRATATAEELERFRLVSGDVLITKDSETWNDIGIPALIEYTADDLICGYHLALLRPRKALLIGEYLLRVWQSRAVAYQCHVAANGVTRYGLSHDAIKSVFFPLPPLSEQAAIVRFLNHIDRRIRRYIRAKQKLITLLEEQKQAIIHRAVTRGLDPNVRLKPSGVEWLGEVPEHWEVVPLRWCVRIGSGDFIPTDLVCYSPTGKNDIPVIGGNGVMGYGATYNSQGMTIVIGRVGALCGNVHLVKGRAWVTDNALRITQVNGFEPEYLALQLGCSNLNRLANANAQPLITGGIVKDQRAVMPPRREQRHVVRALEQATKELAVVTENAQREISLLREYRTRLIADVVTGKLDVREAAARLPDEAEEPEPLHEGQALTEAKEDAADDLDAAPEEAEE